MALESADDLDAYVDIDPTSARWSESGADIDGIFDAAYVDPLGQFEDVAPVFQTRLAKFGSTSPAQGETLRIDGTTYTIAEVRPDGQGWVVIRLRG